MFDISILLNSAQALVELERTLAHSDKGKDSDELKNFRLFLDKFRAPDPRIQQATINISKLKDTFGGIAGRLHMFGTGNFGRVMNTYDPDVRLFEAIRERKVIYVALPTMGKNEAANNFGKMILGDLRTAISWIQALPEPDRPSPPFLCFLDELGSYATASLARPFEQSRSAKIILCGAIQTLANLEAVSEEFRQMVLGNTWTKIYFKLGEVWYCEWMVIAEHKRRTSSAAAMGAQGKVRSRQQGAMEAQTPSFELDGSGKGGRLEKTRASQTPDCPYEEIVALFRARFPNAPKPRALSSTSRLGKAIYGMWRSQSKGKNEEFGLRNDARRSKKVGEDL